MTEVRGDAGRMKILLNVDGRVRILRYIDVEDRQVVR